MPRTVIYDLKGGFGSLKRINALYDIQDDDPAQSSSLWGGQAVVQKAEPIEPSAYQKSLDAGLEPPQLTTDSVRYWSDFNRVFYHPRSIVQLNEYDLNSSIAPFERWDSGEELFAELDKEHDLLDRDMRPFAEEADHMQGIQIMTTVDDAWGGFASRYIERLRDEYGKTTVWVWGLQEGFQGVSRVSKITLACFSMTLYDTFPWETLLRTPSYELDPTDTFPRISVFCGWSTRRSHLPKSTSKLRCSFLSPSHLHSHQDSVTSSRWTHPRLGTPQRCCPRL